MTQTLLPANPQPPNSTSDGEPRTLTPLTGAKDTAAGSPPTGQRLGFALLGYLLAIVLTVTLAPFQVEFPPRLRLLSWGPPLDLAANVAFFVPLGFVYRLTRATTADRWALRVLVMGLVVSAGVECAQAFAPERFTSPGDVLTNGIGAWLGALLADRLIRRLRFDGKLVRRLSLELPLMGIVYLLTPLLWLTSLAADDDPFRLTLLVLLGLTGASLLGSVQRYHFRRNAGVPDWAMALGAANWFLVGSFPALPRWPLAAVAGAAVVGMSTYLRATARPKTVGLERRYEIRSLRHATRFFAAYLVLLVVLPLTGGISFWSAGIGVGSAANELTRIDVVRLLEPVAALTLFGYMLAELWGRRELPFRVVVGRLALWSAPLVIAAELLRGFQLGGGASGVRLLLVFGATLYGGWLYHLQRAHVRRLLAQSPSKSRRKRGKRRQRQRQAVVLR